MKRSFFSTTITIAVLFPLFSFSQAFAAGHGHAREMKKGILLVAFGTSVPSAQKSFDHVAEMAGKEFGDIPVRWAYTSSIIRKKLAKEGKQLDSVEMALARMMDDGFTHVAVQSLHTIRGEEFDDLVQTVQAFEHMPGGFEHLVVGDPLLTSQEDMEKVSRAIIANIPEKRAKKEAVVLMGHGSPHPSNAFYTALMYHLQRKDPLIFIGTVEGSPTIGEIKDMLAEKKVKKVWLVPFMSVAGDHVMNDMAGDEDDSWKSILKKSHIDAIPVMKGTAEYDNMVNIWIDHLKTAMNHL